MSISNLAPVLSHGLIRVGAGNWNPHGRLFSSDCHGLEPMGRIGVALKGLVCAKGGGGLRGWLRHWLYGTISWFEIPPLCHPYSIGFPGISHQVGRRRCRFVCLSRCYPTRCSLAACILLVCTSVTSLFSYRASHPAEAVRQSCLFHPYLT